MIAPERLRAAAQAHGTPIYVYDLDVVAERLRRLRAALPARVEIAYAVKANPSLAVLARVASGGAGADVASGGELQAVARAGFPMAAVVMTGPAKRELELAAAVAAGLRAVTVESLGELERLRSLARAGRRVVPVLLRASGEPRPGNVIGDGAGRFGMSRVDLLEAARRAAAAAEVRLLGVHRFDASNVLEAEALVRAWRGTARVAAEVADAAGARLELVDFGGGLGIPYRDGEAALDLGAVVAGVHEIIGEIDRHPRLAGARLLLEPGRWLVGPAGAYLVRVVDVKRGPDGWIAGVDGGVHHLMRPALVGAHRIVALDGGRRRRVPVLVGGPLCTSLDVLGRAELPRPEVGDLLAVRDTGAYGFTEAMPLFLSHPTPAEIAVSDGRSFVARPPVGPAAILDVQAVAAPLTPQPSGT